MKAIVIGIEVSDPYNSSAWFTNKGEANKYLIYALTLRIIEDKITEREIKG